MDLVGDEGWVGWCRVGMEGRVAQLLPALVVDVNFQLIAIRCDWMESPDLR